MRSYQRPAECGGRGANQTKAMSMMQKLVIGIVLAVAVGSAVYEEREMAELRTANARLQEQQAALGDQMRRLGQAVERITNWARLAESSTRKAAPPAEVTAGGVPGALISGSAPSAPAAEAQNFGRPTVLTFQTNSVGRAAWKFAGYGTPDAAVESLLWAKSTGDEKSFLRGISPEITNAVLRSYLIQGSDAERSQFLKDQGKDVTGLQVINETLMAADEAVVQLRVEVQANGDAREGNLQMVLKKSNGEWKYLNEYSSPEFLQVPLH